jgi:imidazolonepropionase
MLLLIKNIKELVQIEAQARPIVKGADMAVLPTIENAYLLIENDLIKDFGPMTECPERADTTIDATGKMVFPCWCDSHTHLVYAGSREQEFVDRIQGLSYEQISEKGGGILNSAKRLNETSEEELLEQALVRLKEVISLGTGAIEIKSGYGLTLEGELKMLRVIRRLKEISPVKIKATFLGAHSIPLEYRGDRQKYIDIVMRQMLPAVAAEGLAEYCDVFCENGFFTVFEAGAILQAAQRLGLKAKLHANQMGYSGGVQLGVELGAISVDHLEHVGADEIAELLSCNTIPTLLPSSAFFLNNHYPPARDMIDAGLPVTLATDYNPGTTPSGNMPLVLSLACLKMKMLPNEAINAATINGAAAMEIQDEYGSICRGKKANVFITKPIPSVAFLPYSFGSNLVETVVINGKVV